MYPRILLSVALVLAGVVWYLRANTQAFQSFIGSQTAKIETTPSRVREAAPAKRSLSQTAQPAPARVLPNLSSLPPVTPVIRTAALSADDTYRAQIFAKRAQRTNRIKQLAGFQQRVSILSGGVSYQYIPGLFAVREAEKTLIPGPVVGRNAGYVFFEVPAGQLPPEQALPGVYNDRSEKLGAVTGVVTIEFKGSVDLNSVARDFNLEKVQSFDHLRVGILKAAVPLETDLPGLLRAVQTDTRVADASLEIVEGLHVAR